MHTHNQATSAAAVGEEWESVPAHEPCAENECLAAIPLDAPLVRELLEVITEVVFAAEREPVLLMLEIMTEASSFHYAAVTRWARTKPLQAEIMGLSGTIQHHRTLLDIAPMTIFTEVGWSKHMALTIAGREWKLHNLHVESSPRLSAFLSSGSNEVDMEAANEARRAWRLFEQTTGRDPEVQAAKRRRRNGHLHTSPSESATSTDTEAEQDTLEDSHKS